MLTTDQISTALTNANYKLALSVNNDFTLMYGACQPKDWASNMSFKAMIAGLQFQSNRQDYSSDLTYSLYNKVLGCTGFVGTIPGIDPNAQVPGQTTVTVGINYGYNSDKIPFSTTSDAPQLAISDYQNDTVPVLGGTYASRYGNNPSLALYNTDGTLFTGDEQTPPIITYVDNDPTKAIESILWDYPVATAGYIQISGQGTTGANGGSGVGGGSIPSKLTFNQSNLVDDGNGGFYLPVSFGNKTYLYTTINGVGTSVTPDFTTTPARLYGFANADTQTIIVTVL